MNEEILEQYADEDGNIPDEIMAKYVNGELEAKEEEKVEEVEATEEAVKETVEKPADEEEPTVLAKDGKHTIPYSELVEARNQAKQANEQLAILQAKLEEKADLAKQVEEAAESDQADGTTQAMDALTDEMSDWAEDYPGAAKALIALKQQLADLAAQNTKMVEAEQARQKEVEQKTAAEQAQSEFVSAAVEAEPRFLEAQKSDEFWKWFDTQPPHIRAAEKSPDPLVVASVVSEWVKTQASDKGTRKPVERKQSVSSLSDVPGGTSAATEEIDAIRALDSVTMATRMMHQDPRAIESMIARML